MADMDMHAVETAMREVAEAEIRPRFRALAQGDIHLKGPGDYVTEADIASERELTARLQAIVDVPVVGEEASAANPQLPEILRTEPAAWVVDPVDGTANFVHGKETYAVMVSFVEGGVPTAGWILHPETGRMFSAAKGHGAHVNGQALDVLTASDDPTELHGAFSIPHAPEEMRPALEQLAGDFGHVGPPRLCAGFDYTDLATGAVDFLILFRTKPWDHAPGTTILRELGVRVGMLDGSDYMPAGGRNTIIAAPTGAWETVREAAVMRLNSVTA